MRDSLVNCETRNGRMIGEASDSLLKCEARNGHKSGGTPDRLINCGAQNGHTNRETNGSLLNYEAINGYRNSGIPNRLLNCEANNGQFDREREGRETPDRNFQIINIAPVSQINNDTLPHSHLHPEGRKCRISYETPNIPNSYETPPDSPLNCEARNGFFSRKARGTRIDR